MTSFLFDASVGPAHTRIVVRVGPRDHDRALCGVLTMRTEDWHVMRSGIAQLHVRESFEPRSGEVRLVEVNWKGLTGGKGGTDD